MQRLLKVCLLSLALLGLFSGCGGGGKKAQEDIAIYAFKQEFIVNLAKDDSSNYLKASLGLAVDSKKAISEIGSIEFKVRDRINYILSRQTLKSISTDNGKDNIKREIKESLNKILNEGEVSEVYFYEFVSQ